MPTINLNLSPLSVLASIMVLSGIFTHTVQAESLITDTNSSAEHRQNLLTIERHVHIENSGFTSITHGIKAQTPTTRPRDDEDKNYTVKKRVSGDGFGNNFSSSINL